MVAMIANIGFFVFLGGAVLVAASIIIARFRPEREDDKTSKMEWVLIFMLIGGLAMALIGFLVFAIVGAIDNVDRYGRTMEIILLTVAAVVLIALLLARSANVSRAR